MIIKEVTTNKLIQQFHQLPFSIYKNDNNWIPHIKQDVEKVFEKIAIALYNNNIDNIIETKIRQTGFERLN